MNLQCLQNAQLTNSNNMLTLSVIETSPLTVTASVAEADAVKLYQQSTQ